MTDKDVVLVLLNKALKHNEPEHIRTLIGASIAILEGDEEVTPQKAKKVAEQKETKTKKVDHGKICALYKANWSIKAIADELDCNQATVRYRLKKEGLIK